MSLFDVMKRCGRKASFAIVFLVLGYIGLAITNASKSAQVVTLTLGIYAALVTGHVVTDAKAITANAPAKTEEEGS